MTLQQLEIDLKKAMLDRDKATVSALKNIKTSLQYAKVAKKDELDEKEIFAILQKESKKRQEASDLYKKVGERARAEAEIFEKKVIGRYLPEPMSAEEVNRLINQAIKEIGEANNQTMGKIISVVREKSEGRAEGGTIARLVKNRL